MKWLRALALLFVVCAPVGAGAVVASTALDVDRIEILGVSVLNRPDIDGSLEFAVGDKLDRQRVVRTAQNIQALYRSRGYEQVGVNSELVRQRGENGRIETVLRLKVTEGLPTRISGVLLKVEGGARTEPEKLKQSLAVRAGLASGDILDQGKVETGRRAIQSALASDEFVGARVEAHVVEAEKTPSTILVSDRQAAARWVNVEFRVNVGDRVKFGFRGNTAVTRARLQELVEEQRLVGLGNDYIGSLRDRIEEEYRSMGYAGVKVTAYTYERPARQERQVSFRINEGVRMPITSVDFDGNFIFTNKALQEEFFKRASPLVRRRIYVEKDVEKAVALLLEWIKSQGYLAGKLVAINRTFLPENKGVRLLVYIYEGEQTVVQTLRFQGNMLFDPASISKMLAVKEGDPLDLYAFNEGLETLKVAYRNRGYLEMKILNEGGDSVIHYSRENRYADISLEISEGYQYRISRIEIEGLQVGRSAVVRRELAFKEDDVLSENVMSVSEARLRRLGIFSSVTIRGHDDPERLGYRIVRVSVQEGTPGVVAGGFGYRNDLGVRVFGQVAYTDVWHWNHTLSLNASANKRINESFCSDRVKRALQQGLYMSGAVNPIDLPASRADCFVEYQAQVGYTWPWFMFGETTFHPVFSFERTQFNLFDASSVSFSAAWERKLWKPLNLSGALMYSIERIQQFNAASAIDNQTLRIGALTPSLFVDFRDNSLAPTSGFFSSASFEWANPSLGSRTDPFPIGYTRFQARMDGYVPLARDVIWYLSFRTGLERNTETAPSTASLDDRCQYQIPIYKQFALGGAGSLRGFSEQELNVQNMAILGTASYVNYRTQIDLPFAGPLRFGPFLDAANLLVDKFSFGMLRYGTGVGFHYQSPVGSVNFDWGFKVNPRPGEDPFRFYFSIGSI